MASEMQEEEVIVLLSGISLICALVWCHEILVTAPEIAIGDPLQVYINAYMSIS